MASSRVHPNGGNNAAANANANKFWTRGRVIFAIIVAVVVAVFIGVMTGVITRRKDATKCDEGDYGPASYDGSPKMCWKPCTGTDTPIPGDNFHCTQNIGKTPMIIMKKAYNNG